VYCRSKTCTADLKKMTDLFDSEEKKNIHSVRSLCAKVLKDYLKIVKEAKSSPFRWFNEKLTEEDSRKFSEILEVHMDAMKSAIQRLEDLKPATWTVINMHELGKRLVTEITETDRRYEQLSEARALVISVRREAGKADIKLKHAQSMAEGKMSKVWLDNGSSKQVFTILKNIGAH
jgi:hypothetical protein